MLQEQRPGIDKTPSVMPRRREASQNDGDPRGVHRERWVQGLWVALIINTSLALRRARILGKCLGFYLGN